MQIGKPKKNLYYKTLAKIRNFLYISLIRRILFYSRLGRRSMFGYADSGISFDYIYRSKPTGYNMFGKIIDWILLNLPSAKATKERKKIFCDLIEKEISKNRSDNKKTRIVDLASGVSRYILDVIKYANQDFVEALALDIDRAPLKRGSELAINKPILFKKFDIFKMDKLHAFSKKKKWIPNLFIASGLYEYVSDSIMKKSLTDLHRYLDKNGAVIFSWQKDNPNKKLLSKLGRTKSGRKWILYYRDENTVKRWLKEIDYVLEELKIDKWNMYCVYLVRKRS